MTETTPSNNTPLSVQEALDSTDAATHIEAARALSGLVHTLEEIACKRRGVEETMALLLRATRAERTRNLWTTLQAISIVVAALGLLFRLGGDSLIFLWPLLSLLGTLSLVNTASERREAAKRLQRESDPRAVGALAMALRDGDPFVQHIAEQALQELLPRVKASDAPAITPEQWDALRDIATMKDTDSPTSVALKIALCKALEQIGEPDDIPTVLIMVSNPNVEVRAAATACLPYLEARERLAWENATLLRASAQTEAIAPDTLLRPAIPATDTPAEQLLRPTR